MTGSIVRIEAPSRLHFGMLDLRGSLGRRFGGIGAGVAEPSLVIELERAERVIAEGPAAARAAEVARRFLVAHGIADGARIRVHRAIPEHAGLGSGTQLALSVARGLAELYSLPTDVAQLATAAGRAQRSAIGTWLFAGGGFIVEGGRRDDATQPAPLLTRLPIPASWRCVLAIPRSAAGVNGENEAQAFRTLPQAPERDVERVAHLVLMQLLPALVEADLEPFGRALTEIQHINGRWFAPAQGGPFAAGLSTELIARMPEWGARGVGQSSWGPAVYGLVDGDEAAALLGARVREAINGTGDVYVNQFTASGAQVSVIDPSSRTAERHDAAARPPRTHPSRT
jgi:beta-ribofuranosylaminobenzene 5'-phosphate synthase